MEEHRVSLTSSFSNCSCISNHPYLTWFEMNISQAGLDRIEAQRSTDVSHEKSGRKYFLTNLIKRKIFPTLRSLGFLQAEEEGMPTAGDTESLPKFFTNIRLSDLFDLPGEYVPMSPEIFSAMRMGNIEWLEVLRSYGTPMACIKSNQGDSVLHLAAGWGHPEQAKGIISKCPRLLLELDSKDQLPLHVASRAGHFAVVEALVATMTFFSDKLFEEGWERLNPYVLKDVDGNTALHVALKNKNMKIAACLIKVDLSASFLANKDRISPLHLAIEARELFLVKAMLKTTRDEFLKRRDSTLNSHLKGRKDLVHAALKAKNTDILDVILKAYPSLEDERDEEGRTCLSFGASIGYYEGVCNLLDRSTKNVYVCDNDGSFPIHRAREKGHIKVVKEILKRCPDSKQLLNGQGQNIYHIDAKNGISFSFLFRKLWRRRSNKDQLMEEQDLDGNTPLHIATMMWRPRTLFFLLMHATNKCLHIRNNSGLTALEIAESNLQPNYIFMETKITKPSYPQVGDKNKDYVSTLLLVAALVATVTFAAGFTIPGGFNTSTPHLGSATLANDPRLIFFMVFDMLAMQTSVLTIATLVWTQLGDPALVHRSLNVALPLLFFALLCMPMAFYFGVSIAFAHVKGLMYFLKFSSVFFSYGMLFVLGPHVLLRISGIPAYFGVYFLLLVMFESN